LVHSIQNIIQGNTLLTPAHKESNGALRKFDYIVSNPPFNLDFSDFRDALDSKANQERFFAGIPNVPKKSKDKMAVYLLFIQHIMYSLSATGKAAIVVPTGFLTRNSKIEKNIRKKLVEAKMLQGVVSMPGNIFATTNTNVSVLFLDKANTEGDVMLMDASKLGTTVKEGKNQKTLLSAEEEKRIVSAFNLLQSEDDFSVKVSYDQLRENNYSFSAGQYFEIKIEYVDITPEEFSTKINGFQQNLDSLFVESQRLEKEINKQVRKLKYE